MPDFCLSNQDHRVHTPTTRLLRCAGCGRTWSDTGDRMPFHVVETNPVSLEALKAGADPWPNPEPPLEAAHG